MWNNYSLVNFSVVQPTLPVAESTNPANLIEAISNYPQYLATDECSFVSLPEFLIINLGRTQHNRTKSGHTTLKKVYTRCLIPLTFTIDENGKPCQYQLQTGIIHVVC